MASLAERFAEKVTTHTVESQVAFRELQETVKHDKVLQIIEGSPVFLRPGFLSATDRAQVEKDLAAVFELMLSVPERLFKNDIGAMCDAFGLGPLEKTAIATTWRDQDVLLGRADLYHDGTGYKLLEFNIHSSTGGIENADLARAMLQIPFYRTFMAQHVLTYQDTVDGIAEALRSAAQRRGLPERPVVAVTDWHTTYSKFAHSLKRISTLLSERGFEAFPCHIRQMETRGGVLYAANRRVDILYRIFVIEDLLDSPEDLNPVLEAHARGNLVLAMSFVGELVGNKGTLALLSDPANRACVNPDEQALVDRLVPWSRFLQPGPTTWRGEAVGDLLGLVQEHPSQFVLKPVMGYGGRGVITGWTVTAEEWRETVTRVAGGPVRYVVQERVRPVPEPMPFLSPDGVAMSDVVLNWGVYIAGQRYNGAIIRGVPAEGHSVINVTQGAAVGCCFHTLRA